MTSLKVNSRKKKAREGVPCLLRVIRKMSVYGCGWAKNGQLGVGPLSKDLQKDPLLIEEMQGRRIVSIAAGEQSSYALTDMGDVFAWGRGNEGQLGQGDRTSHLVPVRIEGLLHEKITKLSAGSHHCVALTETGRVYTWGKLYQTIEKPAESVTSNNDLGRLAALTGLKQRMIEQSVNRYLSAGTSDEEFQTYTTTKCYYQTSPRCEEDLENEVVVDVAAGYSFSVAVTRSGRVYSWGFNDKGQLGLGHRYNIDRPRLIPALKDVHAIAVVTGQGHNLILTREGHVWSWGLGVFGQLGHGDARDALTPQEIEYFTENNIRVHKLSCGALHSVALVEGGKVYSWGHGEYGQHGGTKNYVDWDTGEKGNKNNHFSVPAPLSGLDDEEIVDISCGHLHNCAITKNGRAFTWGWGASGCLGHGNTRFQLVPKVIEKFLGKKIIMAAASWKHTLFLQSSSESSFATDYQNLVNNVQYSDLHFRVQGRPIFAHKVVVLARCRRLRAIMAMSERFGGQSLTNEEGVTSLEINDVTFPVFLGLIQYLYTDHLKLPPHQIPRLGELARRYHMPHLEALCRQATRALAGFRADQTEELPKSCFSEQMEDALHCEAHTDLHFTLSTTGERRFSAHKAILTRRCEYFASMFASGFREADEKETTISIDEQINPEVFGAFLEFLYGGNRNVITPENICDLLCAADRYMVEDLKQITESMIKESVEEENVCWLLDLADRYNAKRLKRICLDEITQSSDAIARIKQTPGYNDLRASSPDLFREVDYLATKKQVGRF